MGVSYNARALLGVRFKHSDLFDEVEVRGACGHEHARSVKYCPDTGRSTTRTELRCKLGDLDDTSSVEPHKELGGLYVFDDGHQDEVLVGLHAVEAKDYGKPRTWALLDAAKVEAARAACQKHLAPLGLWDPAKFGLQVMLYVAA